MIGEPTLGEELRYQLAYLSRQFRANVWWGIVAAFTVTAIAGYVLTWRPYYEYTSVIDFAKLPMLTEEQIDGAKHLALRPRQPAVLPSPGAVDLRFGGVLTAKLSNLSQERYERLSAIGYSVEIGPQVLIIKTKGRQDPALHRAFHQAAVDLMLPIAQDDESERLAVLNRIIQRQRAEVAAINREQNKPVSTEIAKSVQQLSDALKVLGDRPQGPSPSTGDDNLALLLSELLRRNERLADTAVNGWEFVEEADRLMKLATKTTVTQLAQEQLSDGSLSREFVIAIWSVLALLAFLCAPLGAAAIKAVRDTPSV